MMSCQKTPGYGGRANENQREGEKPSLTINQHKKEKKKRGRKVQRRLWESGGFIPVRLGSAM